MNERLLGEIAAARFTPVRLREGYDMGEVDQFLDELARSLAEGRSVKQLIDEVRFTPTRPVRKNDLGDLGELNDEMAKLRVTAMRLIEAYDANESDQFLHALLTLLADGHAVKEGFDEGRLATVSLREGYDLGEVDQFLDWIRDAAEIPGFVERHSWSSDLRHSSGSGSPALPPAGWYADPNSPDSLAWWSGKMWTEHRRPAL